ncbi:hypothetical protein V1283_005868 [Bradyrhizobium sp. AZCC 2262]|uniref:hypothetical protein n=1 Tax=Bradyrhizobium sp. AZCC 2262 TaxID=3117022 RepID=UPI002FF0388C
MAFGFLVVRVSFCSGVTRAQDVGACPPMRRCEVSAYLAYIGQLTALALSEVTRSDPTELFDEANHRKLAALRAFDLEPTFVAV